MLAMQSVARTGLPSWKKSLAQPDAPGELVVGDRVALGHLRIGAAVRSDRVQRVEHVVAVIAGCAIAGATRLDLPDPRSASNVAAVDFNSTRRCIMTPKRYCLNSGPQ